MLEAISNLYRAREGIIGSETEPVVDSDDLVHFAANGEVEYIGAALEILCLKMQSFFA